MAMEMDMVTCIVVPVDIVEEVRKKLCEKGVMDREHRIEHHQGMAYIPVLRGLEHEYRAEEHPCRRLSRRPASYREMLSLPEGVMERLPSAYDVIGDLVVVRLPDDMMQHSEAVGKALLDFVPGSRAVFLDRGTRGEWRLRELILIAGEGGTRTVHRENGVDLVVDLSKAYFSPRLAGEHWRVACLVEKGENVLDMFTGTGGFPITIAKHKHPGKIVAVDINPHAIDLLEKSIRLNRLSGITTVVGDALDTDTGMQAERVIMNLPRGARRFLEHALECTRSGGTVHYHEIVETSCLEGVARRLEKEYNVEIMNMKEVRTYAPGQAHMVFDMKK